MKMPETIFLSTTGWPFPKEVRESLDDIEYRRVRECVWRADDDWYRPTCNRRAAIALMPGNYCPYCTGRIKVVLPKQGWEG